MHAPARRISTTLVTAVVSLLAVLCATAYLVAPTRTALAVEVAVDASVRVPAGKVVIYGRARDSRGKPLARVRVTMTRARRVRLLTTSRANGTFRKSSALTSGRYVLIAARTSNGKTRSARASITIRRGRAYRVSVRLVRNGRLTVMPIRAY